MKKVLLVVAVLGLGWATQGCRKENNSPEFQNSHSQDSKISEVLGRVKCDDGVLIFENDGHMFEAMDVIALLSKEDRIKWGEKIGFESYYVIEEAVHAAEDKHQSVFYRDIDPNISLEGLINFGLTYEPSETFQYYSNNRIVEYVRESDGAMSIQLNFRHDRFKHVVGEKNIIIVGNKTYRFEKSRVVIFDEDTNTESVLYDAIEKNGGHKWHKGIGENSGERSHYRDITSTTRVRSYIEWNSFFTSQNNYGADFFWLNQAQEKKWNIWAFRESYKPIWGLTGVWSINYQYLVNGNVVTQTVGSSFLCKIMSPPCWGGATNTPCLYPNGSNITGISSGYNTSGWAHNNLPPINMRGAGQWADGFTIWHNAMWVFNDAYSVKLSGGPSGQTIPLIN
jgi:hypothetical protein